ncbi:methylated-DNA--[protein]-cysteine S-methyltransferase [uncultured Parolsenella sp.]|uniref:methylated-DNA--[protein]-cysteine S-methyltransferase n=1 Tax=uncultured Parolsenella sp. TaxID=2083008 RepID=UPI0025DA8E5E|nr:methylated-DNA--[protein]-cysteine S-methyltransferase [uncultured Parolsenella sp.]
MLTSVFSESPVGPLVLGSEDGERLRSCLFTTGRQGTKTPETSQRSHAPIFDQARDWLSRYFAGERPDPAELPLDPEGTAFQLGVWEVLVAIPYGETVTYGWVAERVGENRGKRTSARAVGGAVGANPLGIIIPCHRVIGVNGSLTGFSGGVETKVTLLELEGVAMSRGARSETIKTPSEFSPDALSAVTRHAKPDTACKAIRGRRELMSEPYKAPVSTP